MKIISLDLPSMRWASTLRSLPSFRAMPFSTVKRNPPALKKNVVIAVGNCGLYTGPWGVRVEDTVVVGKEGPVTLTHYSRHLGK